LTAPTPSKTSNISAAEMKKQLDLHGIVRVPSDYFEHGGYRYSSFKDALAAAQRHAKAVVAAA
jgi:hypothetical protein